MINLIVTVNQPIAGTDNVASWNRRVSIADRSWDATRGFADHLDEPGEHELKRPIRIEIGTASVGGVFKSFTGVIPHLAYRVQRIMLRHTGPSPAPALDQRNIGSGTLEC